jgi:hypothetical protein
MIVSSKPPTFFPLPFFLTSPRIFDFCRTSGLLDMDLSKRNQKALILPAQSNPTRSICRTFRVLSALEQANFSFRTTTSAHSDVPRQERTNISKYGFSLQDFESGCSQPEARVELKTTWKKCKNSTTKISKKASSGSLFDHVDSLR